MVIPTVNFMSYNSTGMNTVKADWIRGLSIVTNSNLISIQEHFKKTKTVDKFFKDQFPDKTSYIVEGHREKGQDSGRPKGGLAQMRNKNMDLKVDRISTNNF